MPFGKLIMDFVEDLFDGSDSEPESYEITPEDDANDELFSDNKFPVTKALGNYSSEEIVWMRPQEIVENPKLFVDGGGTTDICQGDLGDCWLLSAFAVMSQYPELLKNVIPEQSFDPEEGYIGEFKFRFYQYGKWVEVKVDDRLPTKNGKLAYVKSESDNEMWGALIEKAFAKLNGNYSNLEGGHACEGMVDLTGGTAELIKLKDMDAHELFEEISECIEDGSLLSTSIQANPHEVEAKKDNGLICGHAYSITGATSFLVNDEDIYHCIRIRNPWGQVEWKGKFSDNDEIWNENIKSKTRFARDNDNDGEFWMDIEDYKNEYTKLEICRINIHDFEGEGKWDEQTMNGEWSNELDTAGGCLNNYEEFIKNPFKVIEVTGGKDSDECVIALQQKHRRKKKHQGIPMLNIGFCVFKLDEDIEESDVLSDMVTRSTRPISISPFINMRDLTKRIKLPGAGKYVIVPSTFRSGAEGKFFMRVYVEKPNYSRQTFW